MQKMTSDQALNIIDQVISKVQDTREGHAILQMAVQTVSEALKAKDEPTKSNKK
jgi:hypothetical protein